MLPCAGIPPKDAQCNTRRRILSTPLQSWYTPQADEDCFQVIQYEFCEYCSSLLFTRHPARKGLVDGTSVLVFGYPKRFELDYLQGNEVVGYEGTCALTSVANLLTQSGRPTTEGQVVQRAIDNNWTVTDPSLPSWQR